MTGQVNQSLLTDPFMQIFWTPYDPLDLASGSLDPLGFMRGYLAIADRFLPGFTTITTTPRYTSMLCAAVKWARDRFPHEAGGSESKVRQERLRVIKSFERAWGLACGLAARDDMVGDQAIRGLRGIRSINRRLDSLSGREKYVTTGSFNLLANQLRYGGIGAYSTFLEECHLASMQSLALRPLGEKLADVFPRPKSDLALHDEDAKLSLDSLREWGQRAHTGDFTDAEGKVLAEALRTDSVRWSSLRLLARVPPSAENEEADLLRGLAGRLEGGGFTDLGIPDQSRAQIRATLHLLEPFERFYPAALFLFDRVRSATTDEVDASLPDLVKGEELREAVDELRQAGLGLLNRLPEARARCSQTGSEIEKVLQESGIIPLIHTVLQEKTNDGEILERILRRHEQVQAGKFEKGQPKAPWLRFVGGNACVCLTAQRYQLAPADRPKVWTDTALHPYRTASASSFIRACKIE